MRKVAIVGVGQLPFRSRYEDKTYLALAFEATKKALVDARLSHKDIGAVVYSIYCELMLRQQMPETFLQDHLGLSGITSLKVSAGAAGEGHSLLAAFSLVASGLADIVLLLGVQKGQDLYSFETRSRGDGLIRGGLSLSGDVTWKHAIGPGGTPSGLTISCLLPHIEKYGGPTPEQVAKASLKNHRNAMVNPNAQLREDVTLEDILYSRIIAWPTTMYECCLYSEGATALILAAEEKAKEITDKPVWISGIGVSDYSMHRLEWDVLGRLPGVAEAARKAYLMSGVKNPVEELDVVELHDIISGVEVMAYEELGLCQVGEGGRLLDEGTVEKTGKIPVNPSGGRVACGHVAGVSGISSMGDVVRQLREEAGPIQVPITGGKGLVECMCGGASMCAVAVFERKG